MTMKILSPEEYAKYHMPNLSHINYDLNGYYDYFYTNRKDSYKSKIYVSILDDIPEIKKQICNHYETPFMKRMIKKKLKGAKGIGSIQDILNYECPFSTTIENSTMTIYNDWLPFVRNKTDTNEKSWILREIKQLPTRTELNNISKSQIAKVLYKWCGNHTPEEIEGMMIWL